MALIRKKRRGIGDFRRKWDDRDGIADFHVAILRTVVLERVSPLLQQVEDEYRLRSDALADSTDSSLSLF